LASLYPCQVDEVVSCDNSICQYSSRLGFGCMICQVSCQYGAITTDGDGIHIDGLKCEECGACVSACPTGALQNERFDDHSFFTYFRKINLPADGTVVLGTEKSLHSLWWWQKNRTFEDTFFLQYENIQSLSLFHFVHLLDCGARSVLVLTDESGENSELEKQIELANKIIAGLFDTDIAVTQSSVDQFIDVVQIETPESFGCSSDITRSFINRRQALAKSLKGLMVRSGKETSFTAENGPLGFTNVSCDAEKCTHCMACLNECQIGAMVADEEHFILGHLGIMCVGCKICVRVCPENALSISSDVTINTSFFSSTELAKADPMQCKKCGKVFGTKKSFERVMAILSSKEAVDTNHFEYCETCRVINLFEAE
jgi:ferredoxin